MNVIKDDRLNLLIRYRLKEDNTVDFIDPCVDEMPAELFGRIMIAFSDIKKNWNKEITDRESNKPCNSESIK